MSTADDWVGARVVHIRGPLLPNIRVLHKGSSISGARAWRITPPSPRDPSGTRKRVPGRMVPLLGVRPFSIQQWKETVLKQLNFYSIEEHFFFWYVNTHFLCVFFDSNRNVDDRSKEDDRQSNTMIPHC